MFQMKSISVIPSEERSIQMRPGRVLLFVWMVCLLLNGSIPSILFLHDWLSSRASSMSIRDLLVHHVSRVELVCIIPVSGQVPFSPQIQDTAIPRWECIRSIKISVVWKIRLMAHMLFQATYQVYQIPLMEQNPSLQIFQE